MKDLKIYYKTSYEKGAINSNFDKKIEEIAKEFGLNFSGSGVEIGTGIRDIHYAESK